MEAASERGGDLKGLSISKWIPHQIRVVPSMAEDLSPNMNHSTKYREAIKEMRLSSLLWFDDMAVEEPAAPREWDGTHARPSKLEACLTSRLICSYLTLRGTERKGKD